MEGDLIYRMEEGLAVITLNRPTVLNALNRAMVAEIRDIARRIEKDPDVFALAITGTGRGFCSGHEIQAVLAATLEGAGTPAPDAQELPALFSFLLRISKPVFSALNGVSAAGGFVLAMMCDMRIASEAASFTVGFSNRGLVAEHGLSWLLPRQIGTSRALDLLWSSRRISAAEALRIGLVDRVVEAGKELEEVAIYVRELRAKTSPRALAEIKAQVYAHLSADFVTAVMDSERRTKLSLTHSDVREGALAFIERRPPRFQPWMCDE